MYVHICIVCYPYDVTINDDDDDRPQTPPLVLPVCHPGVTLSTRQFLVAIYAWWGASVVVCLERGADLHMAQLMPLPLTVSCFSKIQVGFTFLVPAHTGSPGKRAVKRVCSSVVDTYRTLCG